MSLTDFQKLLHYPSEQHHPDSKANSMLTEFPGSFCGTLYHSLTKVPLTPVDDGSSTSELTFKIDTTKGDYLTDCYLTIELPADTVIPKRPQDLVSELVESVSLEWINQQVTLQTLRQKYIDDTFRWRYHVISDCISVDNTIDKTVIVVKLPWFFSKTLGSAIPIMYLKELTMAQPLQVRINRSTSTSSASASPKFTIPTDIKFGITAEYGIISEEERNFLFDKANANPNRHKRVIYEEVTLEQLMSRITLPKSNQGHVVRFSWLSPDTQIAIDQQSVITLNPKTDAHLHWEFFGNEWAFSAQRFSYSIGSTPDRSISTILPTIPFSKIKIIQSGADEDIRFVVEKMAIFIQNVVQVAY